MTSTFSHPQCYWNTNSFWLISASVHLPFFLSSFQQHMEHQQTRGQLGLTWKNEKAVLILKIGCGSWRQLVLLSHRNRSGEGQRVLGVCVERIRTRYERKKQGCTSPFSYTWVCSLSMAWDCDFYSLWWKVGKVLPPPGCQHCVHSQPSNWWAFSSWLLLWDILLPGTFFLTTIQGGQPVILVAS